MNYPVAIFKDKDSDFGVAVPDLPGCVSAGATIDEALSMAREAIELHLEGLIEDGEMMPRPTAIEGHFRDAAYRGATWALVAVDESTLRVKIARVGVTMPQRVLDAVDRHAAKTGETRSGLLARAAVAYIGRGGDSMPKAERGGARVQRIRRGAKKVRKG